MPRIRRLDPVVVDQIAAGEVVERPASVVKELVENALDAGARRIHVVLREGGTRRIEVRDDGCGIVAEDLPLAVSSHATSKLTGPEDLQCIASLGFRGEALASIAAVSRFALTSRVPDAEAGAELRVAFGRVEPVRAAAAAPGTRVVVEDLFGELPARRKFLKRPATEYAHCRAWVERLALAHPEVAFRLEHDGRVSLAAEADEDLDARCAAVFGPRVAEAMVAMADDRSDLRLEARVGPPDAARRGSSRLHVFLNGRWVRDPRLLHAVREGLREYVPLGHVPPLLLRLWMPPELVDVNVHPQKTEVRFREERRVVGSVIAFLRAGLAAAPWATRSVGAVGTRFAEGGRRSWPSLRPGAGAGTAAASAAPAASGEASGSAAAAAPSPAESRPRGGPAEPPAEGSALPGLGAASAPAVTPRPAAALGRSATADVLQVARTFLVREVPEGLEILDQHALHERVNLEELREELRRGGVVVQPLLVPALVEVTREEAALLLEHADALRRAGVELDAMGETTLAVRGIPARLERLQPESLVDDLLRLVRRPEFGPEDLIEETLHSMACRGAVMAGDRLTPEDLRHLLERGAELPQDRTCAHGRPVRVVLSVADLERAFHRR